MKRLPIGVDDYLEAQNYYYVDKTLFIRDLIDSYLSKSILITRPRRFGKSLMMSMVDYYFTNEGDYRYLFEDKEIIRCEPRYLQFMNKYPVVHIDMKNVNGASKEEIIDKAIDLLSTLFKKHSYLLKSEGMFDIDREYFLNVINKRFEHSYDYEPALKKLTNLLYLHFSKKVIVLIDEYDTPIESAFENSVYDECVSFFKELYSNVLKGNEYLLFSTVTGVLQISKESLFSGLNNLEVISVTDKACSDYFGFTKNEVQAMIDDYQLNADVDELEQWYGGYRFGNSLMLNPWSILSYVSNEEIKKYWVNTGSNNLLDVLLKKNNAILDMINGPVSIFINNSLSYRDFAYDDNAIFSYLVQAGYLTAEYVEKPSKYRISIPNLEIYELFKNDIIGRNISPRILGVASQLRQAFAAGDIEKISVIMEQYVVSSFSYYDLRNEKEYQVLLAGILAVLFDTHVVKNEVNNKQGRADIIVSPKKEYDIGMVIEVKYTNYQLSEARLIQTAQVGLNQILKKSYFQELKARNCKSILLFGISFDVRGEHRIALINY